MIPKLEFKKKTTNTKLCDTIKGGKDKGEFLNEDFKIRLLLNINNGKRKSRIGRK